MSEQINTIVIVGGGSSGWMSAALLSRLTGQKYQIQLIESDEISTIGVGEATIPAIKVYNQLCGIDEMDFIRETKATFKLGIEFCHWGAKGDSYFHAFGALGRQWEWQSFYQYWLKAKKLGQALPFEHYCITAMMAQQGKFMPADASRPKSPLAEIAYAYHFDAGLYARYLRKVSEQRGVMRHEGKIVAVIQQPQSGHIKELVLEDGRVVQGDLFLDCSGLRSLLIEQTLKAGFDDWSHWLPANRAWAVPSEVMTEIPPFTRALAHEAGWQWRIPLQHRTGNGLVFSNHFLSEDQAQQTLLHHLPTPATAEPRLIKFTTGKRKKMWQGNCVAIGLASGFLEPLESTSLHLVQTAITRLIHLFPDSQFLQANIDHYNALADEEMCRIRDFIIAHYAVTSRNDSEFWNYCRTMTLPESLQQKLDIFRAHGRVHRVADELFREDSWVQLLLGQGLLPRSYDPLVELKSPAELVDFMQTTTQVIRSCVDLMPSHQDFLTRLSCAAT